MKKYSFTFIFFFVVTIYAGVGFSMDIFNNDFERQWEVLFQDINKLNEYTSKHVVELRDVKVEDHDIEGAIFTGARFIGVDWKGVDATKAVLSKVVFKKCKFIGGKWGHGTFSEITFEDCEFIDTSLSGSIMLNVHFKNCKFERTGIGYLKGSKVEFDGCTWDTGAGGDSSCEFIFRNCSLIGISFSAMKDGVSLIFENCLLDEIDFYRSHLSDVVLRRVRQGEGGVKFNSVTAKTISFEDVEMLTGIGMGYANVDTVRIVGGKVYGPAFKKANIRETYIRDAYVTRFALGNMGKVSVSNSTLHRSGFFEGGIDEFSVSNSTIDEIVGKGFTANIVLWDNVTLDGKIDLTNAQIQDFRPTRLKRGPRLELITTGSNMKF